MEEPTVIPALTDLLVRIEEHPELDVEEHRSDLERRFRSEVMDMAYEFHRGRQVDLSISDSGPLDDRSPKQSGRRSDELFRYLQRTADVENPTRDIIYGTSVGRIFGLDPQVANAIEDEAVDGRDRRAGDLVAELSEDEQRAAIRLLCDLVGGHGVLGRQAFNALMTTLERVMPLDMALLRSELGRAFSKFQLKNEVPDRHIETALEASRWVRDPLRADLQVALIGRSAWREDVSRIQRTIATAPWWVDHARDLGGEALIELATTQSEAVVSALLDLPREALARIWSRELWSPLSEQEIISAVVERLAESSRETAWGGVGAFLDEARYSDALEVMRALGGTTTASEAIDVVVATSSSGVESADWNHWFELVNEGQGRPHPADAVNQWLEQALEAVSGGRLAGTEAIGMSDSIAGAPLSPTSQVTLPRPNAAWGRSAGEVDAHTNSVQLLRYWSQLWPDIDEFAAVRLDALESVASDSGPVSSGCIDLLWSEALELSKEPTVQPRLDGILSRVESKPTQRLEDSDKLLVGAVRLILSNERLQPDLLQRAARDSSGRGDEVLRLWLLQESPSWQAVTSLLDDVDPPGRYRHLSSAFATYLSSLSRGARTEVVVALAKRARAATRFLLAAVAPEQVVQTEVARAQASVITEAENRGQRQAACRQIEALGINSEGAQRILIAALDEKMRRDGTQATADDFTRNFPSNLRRAPGAYRLLKELDRRSRRSFAKRLLTQFFDAD